MLNNQEEIKKSEGGGKQRCFLFVKLLQASICLLTMLLIDEWRFFLEFACAQGHRHRNIMGRSTEFRSPRLETYSVMACNGTARKLFVSEHEIGLQPIQLPGGGGGGIHHHWVLSAGWLIFNISAALLSILLLFSANKQQGKSFYLLDYLRQKIALLNKCAVVGLNVLLPFSLCLFARSVWHIKVATEPEAIGRIMEARKLCQVSSGCTWESEALNVFFDWALLASALLEVILLLEFYYTIIVKEDDHVKAGKQHKVGIAKSGGGGENDRQNV